MWLPEGYVSRDLYPAPCGASFHCQDRSLFRSLDSPGDTGGPLRSIMWGQLLQATSCRRFSINGEFPKHEACLNELAVFIYCPIDFIQQRLHELSPFPVVLRFRSLDDCLLACISESYLESGRQDLNRNAILTLIGIEVNPVCRFIRCHRHLW